jgi:hypothetical protein
MSNSDKPDDEIPEDFSTSLCGSSITKDDDEKDETSSTGIMKDFVGTCPTCHKKFSDPSTFDEHLRSHT